MGMLHKDETYFNCERTDVARIVELGRNKILEIGCAAGVTAEILKSEGKAAEIVGIELVPEIAEIAQHKLNSVICGNIETLELSFEDQYFNYIIAADVLEHLRDPWAVILKLTPFLKHGGFFVASIPNIRYWGIIRDLVINGEWEYKEAGILDDTHLRFFTKKSIRKLFPSGFYTFEVYPIGMQWKAEMANNISFGLFEDVLAVQYLIKAKKL
jgi:2-polyprenyl-3-methyl-5-hydroxy-6-metoxy-1,4-benzoquinol methylase